MAKTILALIVGSSLLLAPTPSLARDANWRHVLSDSFYYEIGGGAQLPGWRHAHTSTASSGVTRSNFSCGDFDRLTSVNNILSEVRSYRGSLLNRSPGNPAGLVLARTDPQAYEALKEEVITAELMFEASLASCQKANESMVLSGLNKTSEWVKVAGFEQWQDAASDGGSWWDNIFGNNDKGNLIKVDREIQASEGNYGVQMPGGRMGGANQSPINIDREAVYAGVNALLGRQPTDNSRWQPLSGTSANHGFHPDSTSFMRFWSSPQEVFDWFEAVLGSVEIRTCSSCESMRSRPGRGIYAVMEEEQSFLVNQLHSLVAHPGDLYDQEKLEVVSGPGFSIRSGVIEALKAETFQRDAFIELLAEEIALTRTIQRIISVRRILYTGKRNPYINRLKPAIEHIDDRITELTQEMDIIREDYEFRAVIKSSVARALLSRLERDQYAAPDFINDDVTEVIFRLRELIE